jgi:hypothetical protein
VILLFSIFAFIQPAGSSLPSRLPTFVPGTADQSVENSRMGLNSYYWKIL